MAATAEKCTDEQMVVRRLAVQEAKTTIRELIENWVLRLGYRHLGYLQAKNGFDVKLRPGVPL